MEEEKRENTEERKEVHGENKIHEAKKEHHVNHEHKHHEPKHHEHHEAKKEHHEVKHHAPRPVFHQPSHEPKKPGITDKMRENPFILATLVLGIITLILLVGNFSPTGNAIVGGDIISEEQAGEDVLNFVKAQTGGEGELSGVESFNDYFYQVNVKFQGQDIPLFLSKDGVYFTSQLSPLGDLNAPAGEAPQGGSEAPDAPSVVKEVSVDDDAIKGDPNAPVTIIEFSDYECPFCGRHFEQTGSEIIEKYVDTGKVKLVFRDFPLGFHDKAQKAGEAAECAGEQGKYWDMHDKLFENQDSLDVDDLKKYAGEIVGLDVSKFNECLDSDAMADEIKADMAAGQAAGVSGTPAFFINGRFLSGAQPFSAFEKIIEEELAKVA